jgi:16S rRNA (cytidine1402-2'-O)-methyltransferase
MAGRLFVVATPIGNMEDLSPRAVRVLNEADLIAAEDTRHSRKLLDHFDIDTPLTSYHEHNEREKAAVLVAELEDGKDIALITDAGTPCVSDPGYRVVRAASEAGIEVVAIPGASALLAALSISGLPSDCFTFHGFFPRKRGACKDILKLVAKGGTHIVYESPHRLVATLDLLAEQLPEAEVCVARELTKLHEEVLRGTPVTVRDFFADRIVKGECVILIHQTTQADGTTYTDAELRERVEAFMAAEDVSRRDAARQIAMDLNLPRRRVYNASMEEA